jgi:hypothetical protein
VIGKRALKSAVRPKSLPHIPAPYKGCPVKAKLPHKKAIALTSQVGWSRVSRKIWPRIGFWEGAGAAQSGWAIRCPTRVDVRAGITATSSAARSFLGPPGCLHALKVFNVSRCRGTGGADEGDQTGVKQQASDEKANKDDNKETNIFCY